MMPSAFLRYRRDFMKVRFFTLLAVITIAFVANAFSQAACGDKDYDCKIEQATKQINANPKAVAGYLDRGDAYYNSGRYTEALADYSKWVEMEPTNAQAFEYRGDTYN